MKIWLLHIKMKLSCRLLEKMQLSGFLKDLALQQIFICDVSRLEKHHQITFLFMGVGNGSCTMCM